MASGRVVREWSGKLQIGKRTDAKIGFFGKAPASRPAAWTVTNHTADKTIDCNAAVAVIGDGLGSLIDDLITLGILQGSVS